VTPDPILDELCRAAADLAIPELVQLPSRAVVLEAVGAVRSAFFPGYFGAADLSGSSLRRFIGAELARTQHQLQEQVARALSFVRRAPPSPESRDRASDVVQHFIHGLPDVRRLVASDVEAAFAGDPALRSRDEAIFSYPGLSALINQRLAHLLHRLEVPLLPRMITEEAHSRTGIDIHPGAQIGASFFIDHGTGVVIGETARVGERVRIYQGVTLGAKSFPKDVQGRPVKGIDRHPIVEDDVVIYAGATILGRVTIGRGSVIGGNVWLTRTVPPESRITQAEGAQQSWSGGGGI